MIEAYFPFSSKSSSDDGGLFGKISLTTMLNTSCLQVLLDIVNYNCLDQECVLDDFLGLHIGVLD